MRTRCQSTWSFLSIRLAQDLQHVYQSISITYYSMPCFARRTPRNTENQRRNRIVSRRKLLTGLLGMPIAPSCIIAVLQNRCRGGKSTPAGDSRLHHVFYDCTVPEGRSLVRIAEWRKPNGIFQFFNRQKEAIKL